jgi:hypothetical protein
MRLDVDAQIFPMLKHLAAHDALVQFGFFYASMAFIMFLILI